MRLTVLLGALLFAAAGCQSAFGNYFANRGRDLGECFRVEGGFGLGVGGTARVAGLIDVGVQASWLDTQHGFGWVYGRGYLFERRPEWDGVIVRYTLPGWHQSREHWTTDGSGKGLGVHSWGVPSALWQERGTPIWSPQPRRDDTWARLHAFDVELFVHALPLHVGVGFSPGEFLDFVLGWFGLDIAGDDAKWKPPRDG